MRSRRTAQFRRQFEALPRSVQQQAQRAYRRFKANPYHRSLHFKQVHAREAIYSVRITRTYRALGRHDSKETGILWFWIGSHADYERLLGRI